VEKPAFSLSVDQQATRSVDGSHWLDSVPEDGRLFFFSETFTYPDN